MPTRAILRFGKSLVQIWSFNYAANFVQLKLISGKIAVNDCQGFKNLKLNFHQTILISLHECTFNNDIYILPGSNRLFAQVKTEFSSHSACSQLGVNMD